MDPRLPPLSNTARELLAKERAAGAEDSALKQRVLARARAALEERPSGILLRRATDGAPHRSARAPRTFLLMAAAVAVAGFAAAGAGFYTAQRGEAPNLGQFAAAPPRPVALPRVVRSEPASATPVNEAPALRPAAPAPAAESPKPSSASTYAVELGLLEPARQNIARGDFGAALSALAQHQREFPRGQLTEEREALKVRALWGMGQRSQAESAASAFRKRYPHSGLLSWMTAAKSP